jgi:hypothetical protein
MNITKLEQTLPNNVIFGTRFYTFPFNMTKCGMISKGSKGERKKLDGGDVDEDEGDDDVDENDVALSNGIFTINEPDSSDQSKLYLQYLIEENSLFTIPSFPQFQTSNSVIGSSMTASSPLTSSTILQYIEKSYPTLSTFATFSLSPDVNTSPTLYNSSLLFFDYIDGNRVMQIDIFDGVSLLPCGVAFLLTSDLKRVIDKVSSGGDRGKQKFSYVPASDETLQLDVFPSFIQTPLEKRPPYPNSTSFSSEMISFYPYRSSRLTLLSSSFPRPYAKLSITVKVSLETQRKKMESPLLKNVPIEKNPSPNEIIDSERNNERVNFASPVPISLSTSQTPHYLSSSFNVSRSLPAPVKLHSINNSTRNSTLTFQPKNPPQLGVNISLLPKPHLFNQPNPYPLSLSCSSQINRTKKNDLIEMDQEQRKERLLEQIAVSTRALIHPLFPSFGHPLFFELEFPNKGEKKEIALEVEDAYVANKNELLQFLDDDESHVGIELFVLTDPELAAYYRTMLLSGSSSVPPPRMTVSQTQPPQTSSVFVSSSSSKKRKKKGKELEELEDVVEQQPEPVVKRQERPNNFQFRLREPPSSEGSLSQSLNHLQRIISVPVTRTISDTQENTSVVTFRYVFHMDVNEYETVYIPFLFQSLNAGTCGLHVSDNDKSVNDKSDNIENDDKIVNFVGDDNNFYTFAYPPYVNPSKLTLDEPIFKSFQEKTTALFSATHLANTSFGNPIPNHVSPPIQPRLIRVIVRDTATQKHLYTYLFVVCPRFVDF